MWISPPALSAATKKNELDACRETRDVMQRLADIDQLRADYQVSRPTPRDPWIHTSTWVISTDPAAEGGHNLDFTMRQVERLPAPRRWQDALGHGGHPIPNPIVGGGWPGTAGIADKRILGAYRGAGASDVARLVRIDGHYESSFGDRSQVFKSWTLADATDTLASVLRNQAPARPLRIHLENIEPAEARNFRTQTERAIKVMGGTHEIETVTLRGTVDHRRAKRLGEVMSFEHLHLEEPEWIEPNVVQAKIIHSPPGRLRAFFLNLQIRFRSVVSDPVRTHANRLINTAYSALGRSGSRLDASFALHRSLLEGLRKAGIEATVEIAHEADDIVVVEIERPMGHSRS
jgi:hypothetical protein